MHVAYTLITGGFQENGFQECRFHRVTEQYLVSDEKHDQIYLFVAKITLFTTVTSALALGHDKVI